MNTLASLIRSHQLDPGSLHQVPESDRVSAPGRYDAIGNQRSPALERRELKAIVGPIAEEMFPGLDPDDFRDFEDIQDQLDKFDPGFDLDELPLDPDDGGDDRGLPPGGITEPPRAAQTLVAALGEAGSIFVSESGGAGWAEYSGVPYPPVGFSFLKDRSPIVATETGVFYGTSMFAQEWLEIDLSAEHFDVFIRNSDFEVLGGEFTVGWGYNIISGWNLVSGANPRVLSSNNPPQMPGSTSYLTRDWENDPIGEFEIVQNIDLSRDALAMEALSSGAKLKISADVRVEPGSVVKLTLAKTTESFLPFWFPYGEFEYDQRLMWDYDGSVDPTAFPSATSLTGTSPGKWTARNGIKLPVSDTAIEKVRLTHDFSTVDAPAAVELALGNQTWSLSEEGYEIEDLGDWFATEDAGTLSLTKTTPPNRMVQPIWDGTNSVRMGQSYPSPQWASDAGTLADSTPVRLRWTYVSGGGSIAQTKPWGRIFNSTIYAKTFVWRFENANTGQPVAFTGAFALMTLDSGRGMSLRPHPGVSYKLRPGSTIIPSVGAAWIGLYSTQTGDPGFSVYLDGVSEIEIVLHPNGNKVDNSEMTYLRAESHAVDAIPTTITANLTLGQKTFTGSMAAPSGVDSWAMPMQGNVSAIGTGGGESLNLLYSNPGVVFDPATIPLSSDVYVDWEEVASVTDEGLLSADREVFESHSITVDVPEATPAYAQVTLLGDNDVAFDNVMFSGVFSEASDNSLAQAISSVDGEWHRIEATTDALTTAASELAIRIKSERGLGSDTASVWVDNVRLSFMDGSDANITAIARNLPNKSTHVVSNHSLYSIRSNIAQYEGGYPADFTASLLAAEREATIAASGDRTIYQSSPTYSDSTSIEHAHEGNVVQVFLLDKPYAVLENGAVDAFVDGAWARVQAGISSENRAPAGMRLSYDRHYNIFIRFDPGGPMFISTIFAGANFAWQPLVPSISPTGDEAAHIYFGSDFQRLFYYPGMPFIGSNAGGTWSYGGSFSQPILDIQEGL